MNYRGVLAIYKFEMARTGRSLFQSVVSPVMSTCLYFVVFGSAIGSRITEVDGHQLRHLHCARSDHALAPHPKRVQRFLWNIFPEICGHDLRAALSSGVLV